MCQLTRVVADRVGLWKSQSHVLQAKIARFI